MARRVTTLPLGMHLTPPPRAKGRWVVEAVRIAVHEGRLGAGSQMPSSRDLAAQWGISRGIVSAAYEELQTEGLLESVVGSGTYVGTRANHGASAPAWDARDEPPRPIPLGEHPSWVRVNPEKPFIARETDVSQFPIGVWKRLAQQVFSNADKHFFYDPDPGGFQGLREQVARYLGFARGIRCEPDDIVITTGIRHGLDLCLRSLTRPGEAVWTESPGYGGADALLRLHGLAAVPVPVDVHGMRVETAEERAPNAKLCIVTPSHQSPLGVRLSFERRQALLAWAEREDAYVFEDDYDGEFAFGAVRFPAFKAMDTADRVIHAGSFNKVLFPTLRIGYLVLPSPLRARVRKLREETGRNNSAIDQHILSYFLSEGHFAQHIRRMGRVYREKCSRTLQVISGAYGGRLEVHGDHGGFHFFLALPGGVNTQRLLQQCSATDLRLQIAALHTEDGSRTGVVIGYSSLTADTIDQSGCMLGNILKIST